MFRKTTTAVLAAASLAIAGLGASAAVMPAAADAAYPICRAYGMPSYSVMQQSNGWTITLIRGNDGWWYAYADDHRGHTMWSNYVTMGSYGGNPSQPYYTISWPRGGFGRYYAYANSVNVSSIHGTTYDQNNTPAQFNDYYYPVCLSY
jgi:hypothetical protein